MKRTYVSAGIIVLVVAVLIVVFKREDTGVSRFFKNDQEFHYMALRVMGDSPFGGAEPGEVLSIIGRIPEGDDEKWFDEWNNAAANIERSGRLLKDPISRGNTMLRAHSYYRNAEFFLSPHDPRKLVTFEKGKEAFYDGIDALGIRYEKIRIPYGRYFLNAVYYPAGKGLEKPLLFTCGGFDSTLEEQYFLFIKAAIDRGYSCLSFEGPGQSSIIREQGLTFTHEWEKPSRAVLDEYLRHHEKPRKIVMVGSSLGGYLAPRAAAFDSRIDGVVAFGVIFDFSESAKKSVPGFVEMLLRNGFRKTARTLMEIKMHFSTTVRWGINHAQWVLGVNDPVDLFDAMAKFRIETVADKIRCHVLIVSGDKDHLVSVDQVERFKKSLVNARSVTTKIITDREGGGEHCQMGAFGLFHAVLFDWIETTIK